MLPESFTNHPVFEKLEQFNQVLISESAKQKITTTDYSFFESTYKYIKDRLKLTIPILVQEAELTNLTAEIDSGTVQINAYLGNDNIGHITNARNNYTSALNRVRNLPFPLSKGDFDFSKSIAGFEQTVVASYKNLEGINTKLLQDLQTAQDDILAKYH